MNNIHEKKKKQNMNKNYRIVLYEAFKIVKFLFWVFIVTDIAILIRALLMNYGEKLEPKNVIKTIIIFGTTTIFLYLIKSFLGRKLNSSK